MLPKNAACDWRSVGISAVRRQMRVKALAPMRWPSSWRLKSPACAPGGGSLRDIAEALNRRDIASARGRGWGPAQILRLIHRAQNAVATGARPIASLAK
jgi:hypothetical protein